MTRLTYRDALKILGAGHSPLVSALDKVFGGLLLASTPFVPGLLSIFDAKSELTRLANDLVARGIDKRHRLSQFDRIQRLHAARGVLMVTAYFEALEQAELPFPVDALQLSRKDQVSLAAAPLEGGSLAEVTATVLESDLPLLGVQSTSSSAQEELGRFYRRLNKAYQAFLEGLSPWDELDATQQMQAIGAIERVVPAALRLFDVSMQRLAADCPEFAIWLNLSGQRVIHDRVENIYDAVQALLERAQPVERVAPALQGVVRFNRSVLSRKLVAVEELPEGLDTPTVGRAYIDPHYRMVEVNTQTPINDEDFWSQVGVRTDFNEFLLGYLSTPWAWTSPLVILGHPGAGKSLLTEVQAARLPSPDFVCVRVPLRDVPADVDVHEQIEHAIRLSTHESVSWPDFARAAGDSLLVVLLDGFDELLQATGVSKSDYLLRVKRFQAVEETQGRHVAVIVTSRVTVADRMRMPGNTVAVRLEPFEINQVEQWVEVWNETNRDYLLKAERGFFDLDMIEAYLDLARQPLLLLMLAVYEAESGALRAGQAKLSQTELYDRLLRRFAHREVSKQDDHSDEDAPAVERELLILSVVALGMFNRGAQWITDEQLAGDLTALGITSPSAPVVTAGHHRLAGDARDALGRFFYIHRARTTLEGLDLGTYEFLHATFGEYLVVRLIWRCLNEMADRARIESARMFSGHHRVYDAELRAFLSWALLSVRTTTLDFLAELITRTPQERLAEMRDVLLAAFRSVHQPETNSAYHAYQPVDMTQTARLATYSANLLLLMMTIGPDVSSDELYPDAPDHVVEWTRSVQLWRSQLRSGEWNSLTGLFTATRLGNRATGRAVRLTHRESTTPYAQHFDPAWTHEAEILDEGYLYGFPMNVFRSAELLCDSDQDMAANGLGGRGSLFAQLLPFHVVDGGRVMSFASDLVAASLFHINMTSLEGRMDVYRRLVHFFGRRELLDVSMTQRFDSHVLQLLVNDDLVPSAYVLQSLLEQLQLALHPPYGLHNLGLLLRLLSRCSEHEEFLAVLRQLLDLNEVSLEQAAEIWCALADKGIATSQYPEELRDHAYALRWPEREEPLAHRPDLLTRLSALEDEELL